MFASSYYFVWCDVMYVYTLYIMYKMRLFETFLLLTSGFYLFFGFSSLFFDAWDEIVVVVPTLYVCHSRNSVWKKSLENLMRYWKWGLMLWWLHYIKSSKVYGRKEKGQMSVCVRVLAKSDVLFSFFFLSWALKGLWEWEKELKEILDEKHDGVKWMGIENRDVKCRHVIL